MLELIVEGLRRANVVLTSTSVLFAVSLMAYLFVYNIRNAVARAFVLLLALVSLVYVGDLFLSTARLEPEHPAAAFWLRFQWLGIAFAAPAFALFATALLEATGARSRPRRWALAGAFGLGGLALLLVLGLGPAPADWLVGEVVGPPGTVRFTAGPAFPLFALWHVVLTAASARGIWRARQRALTHRTRRRTTALLVSVIAPLSVFPLLTAGGAGIGEQALLFRLVNMSANVAIAGMLLFVAWEVAYRGSLTPERAVRRDLVKYLVQGPLLCVFILATIQLVPLRLEASLGLPRDIVLMLWTIGGIVVYQFLVRAVKPWVDRLIFSGEGEDVSWLRRIDERLVSERDLRQLLENVLAVLCDRLRVSTGAILVVEGEGLSLDAVTGNRSRTLDLLQSLDGEALEAVIAGPAAAHGFVALDGFLLHPLRSEGGEALLGLLAIEDPASPFDPRAAAAVATLVAGAERALEERVIQRRVVGALRALEPELEGIQRLRGSLEPATAAAGAEDAIEAIEAAPTESPEFSGWVRDALSHYWGGPKLSESPLLDLAVVRAHLASHDGNPTRALRAVLDQALDQLKPGEGQRSTTASEWLLYNILELKFVRGMKVRDLARRLAVSESDLYRKQRVAIDALATQLRAMEAGSTEARPRPDPPPEGAGDREDASRSPAGEEA